MDFSLILDSFNQAEAELQVIFGGAGGGQAVATVTLTGTLLEQVCVFGRLAS